MAMSVVRINRLAIVMQDKNLSLRAKGVYGYFYSCIGEDGTCSPTREEICYDLCISNDSLSKYLGELINAGYLSCEQIKEHGKFSHNVYTI